MQKSIHIISDKFINLYTYFFLQHKDKSLLMQVKAEKKPIGRKQIKSRRVWYCGRL